MVLQELQGCPVVECLVSPYTVIDILPVHEFLIAFTHIPGTLIDLVELLRVRSVRPFHRAGSITRPAKGKKSCRGVTSFIVIVPFFTSTLSHMYLNESIRVSLRSHGNERWPIAQRPYLLSDHGHAFIAKSVGDYLGAKTVGATSWHHLIIPRPTVRSSSTIVPARSRLTF